MLLYYVNIPDTHNETHVKGYGTMSRENENFDFDRAYFKKYCSYRLQTW